MKKVQKAQRYLFVWNLPQPATSKPTRAGWGCLAGDTSRGRGMRDYRGRCGASGKRHTSQALDASGKVVDSFKNYDYDHLRIWVRRS